MFDVCESVDGLIDDITEDYYETCYDIIYEELCDRVESGELTIEEAEMINDVAYDRYVTEFKSDIQRFYDDRRTREKLSHNHNPERRNLPLEHTPYVKFNMSDYEYSNQQNKRAMEDNKYFIDKDHEFGMYHHLYKKRMKQEREDQERRRELREKMKKYIAKKKARNPNKKQIRIRL